MTVKELIEMLQTYAIADSANLNIHAVDENYFPLDSIETDIDENGDRVVVIY